MKAIVYGRYGGPDQLRLADLPIPEPRKGQVRIKVSACAVNLSDWEYLVGAPFYARLVGGLWRPRQPVLGSDVVGIVDKLGPGVVDVSLGQRVMGDFVMTRGGFAEYVIVPVAEVARVPDSLADEIAACLPQAGGIALAGTSDLRKGCKFLINGAGGGSGTMALQLAKAAGAHVTAVDNASKSEWLNALDADQVIDYRKVDFAQSGTKWDIILDMVATRGPWRISKALSQGGRYKATGGRVSVLLRLVLGGLFFRLQGKLIGMLVVPTGRQLTEQIARMAVEGIINPHLEAVLTLSDVPEALRRTGQGEVRGKLVIKP